MRFKYGEFGHHIIFCLILVKPDNSQLLLQNMQVHYSVLKQAPNKMANLGYQAEEKSHSLKSILTLSQSMKVQTSSLFMVPVNNIIPTLFDGDDKGYATFIF